MQNVLRGRLGTLSALLAVALVAMTLPLRTAAQDRDDDDPPGRAARLGHLDGSVSFQPAGESEWVDAAPNRPMTTGDKLWTDRDSRAEVELGATSIRLNQNTGISFLNLDDRTVQIQLSSGTINVRVRRLGHDDVFEVDTPNQAFSILQSGQYRLDASEDGTYTIVTVRDGEGESTGNGQTYTVHAGQRATFSGTDRLNADVQQVGDPDGFDRWSGARDRRFEESRSAQYVSHDVVGYEDLDEYGDWQRSPEYGHVWYPRVAVGWAPYHTGHWAWIAPWGWTWVDEAPWGYAPFHYGRWAFVRGRWGWVPGPVEVAPVYAPALVVFVGGHGVGANVAWFPLGPREVYVPSYHVSRGYVNRVNISNTVVNQTTVTNVYNTTIVNKTTVINNVTYVNRNVSGAVTAVPQRGFAGGQPVSHIAVPINRHELARAQMTARVAVAPSETAVLGPRSNIARPVNAPPRAVFNREVIAKTAPPPAPVSFAAQQRVLAQHPGQPVAREEMQRLRPTDARATQPLVRQAPPSRPGLTNNARPGNPSLQPASEPAAQPVRIQPAVQPGNQPGNRPYSTPAANGRPGGATQPNRGQPESNRPFEPPTRNDRPVAQPNNRPEVSSPATNRSTESNRSFEPPARNDRPVAQPNNRPEVNSPVTNRPSESNRPFEPPVRNDRPVAQPNNRPEVSSPATNRPPESNRPFEPPARNDRPVAQPNNRPEVNSPAPNRPTESNRSAEPPARNDRPSAPQQPTFRPAQPSQPVQNAHPVEQPRHEEAPPRPQSPPPAAHSREYTPAPAVVRPSQPAQPQHTQAAPKAQTADDKKKDKK